MIKRALIALLVLNAGCAAVDSSDSEVGESTYGISLSPVDATGIVNLVNYPGTDLDTLDRVIGIDSRAARGIVAHRDGADGVSPSSDDVLFPDLATLDAVPYVGDVAFQKLNTYAQAHPAPATERVEGVGFSGWQSQAVVWGVNNLDLSVLNSVLDLRAAETLIAHRPYVSVTQMGPVPYVGMVALTQLRSQSTAWWTQMRVGSGSPSLAGTFDGVTFDANSAGIALEIANMATSAQLTAHGIYATGAAHILAHRTYTTVAQVAAVDGVGTSTMQALLVYARSGQWVTPVTPAYTIDAAALTSINTRLKQALADDADFATSVRTLAGSDDEATLIIAALDAQIEHLTASLLGSGYASADAAYQAASNAAPVKQLTLTGGWTYLASLGLTQPGESACFATFDSSVGPHLPDLLFMSESDRPFDIVHFAGAGAAAPTAASVLALVHAAPGSTAELRDVANYYVAFEPNLRDSDSQAAADVQAAFGAQLHNVVYVAVFQPADSIDRALVDVYLVGQDVCGNLVGIHAIAVET